MLIYFGRNSGALLFQQGMTGVIMTYTFLPLMIDPLREGLHQNIS